MGMMNQAKCDACGVLVNANKSMAGEPTFPPDWHVLHWQVKKNGGFDNRVILSYCPECGKRKLKEGLAENAYFGGRVEQTKTYTTFMAMINVPDMCAKCCEPEEMHSPDAEKACRPSKGALPGLPGKRPYVPPTVRKLDSRCVNNVENSFDKGIVHVADCACETKASCADCGGLGFVEADGGRGGTKLARCTSCNLLQAMGIGEGAVIP